MEARCSTVYVMTENNITTPLQPNIDNLTTQPDNVSSSKLNNKTYQFNLESTMKKSYTKLALILSLVAIVAGIGTGFGAYKLQQKTGVSVSNNQPTQQIAGDVVNAGDIFGVNDTSTFKDNAAGYLEKGGIDGEGSHKLLRVGGESQTVYLTSSVTDLDDFVGMEVEVWGETNKAQKAGWLMDVGSVKIVNTDGEKPAEE